MVGPSHPAAPTCLHCLLGSLISSTPHTAPCPSIFALRSKHVGFPPRLKMNSRWLAADSRDRSAEYELIATVTHHGKTIAAGHYTADVKQPGGQ